MEDILCLVYDVNTGFLVTLSNVVTSMMKQLYAALVILLVLSLVAYLMLSTLPADVCAVDSVVGWIMDRLVLLTYTYLISYELMF